MNIALTPNPLSLTSRSVDLDAYFEGETVNHYIHGQGKVVNVVADLVTVQYAQAIEEDMYISACNPASLVRVLND